MRRTKQPELQHIKIVSHKWVIDSIVNFKLMDEKDYLPPHALQIRDSGNSSEKRKAPAKKQPIIASVVPANQSLLTAG
jgi:hypothetical protein